jgi:tRNA pseudouridine55 synthase
MDLQHQHPDRVLLIDKPLGWTSFDVVNKLRYTLKTKKIGHAGTLDPLATGLLILCTGKMTKRIDEYQAQEKEYTGTFTLGQTTPSYDLETTPSPAVNIDHLTDDDILKSTLPFIGRIQQIPPVHSAIRVGGKRAYEFARQGKALELNAREVTITEFEITKIEKPIVSFRVVCSKGTYIRSLAHDVGKQLAVGAHLSSLCRTRIGNFKLDDALRVDQVEL